MFWESITISIVLLYIALLYLENFRGNRKRPPGPIRIPPFGNLLQVALKRKPGHIALHELGKKFGDVMSIKMGFVDTVVLSSYEAIKTVLSKKEAYGRDCSGMIGDRILNQNIGLGFSNGQVQVETRKFTRDTLRNYGYGNRDYMQTLVLGELTEFLKYMEHLALTSNHRRLHIEADFFNKTFLNLMCTLMMGKRYNYDHLDFQSLLKWHNDMAKNGAMGMGLLVAYPFLRHVFPETLGYNTMMKGSRGYYETAMTHLNERRGLSGNQNPQCFTDSFILKMNENSTSATTMFTEQHYGIIFADIAQAGTETSSSTINFIVLLLAVNQPVQQKLHEEVDNVVGATRYVGLLDKPLMAYTQAVVLEGIRWSRTLVFGVPRVALEDFTYRDYHIRKDTVILMNLQTVFFDETFWGDPHVFRPERFFNSDGDLDAQKTERMQIVFGAGKRICFGEALARDSLFIFVATLSQKFKFDIPPGLNPSLEPGVALTLFPEPYDLIVTPRNKLL